MGIIIFYNPLSAATAKHFEEIDLRAAFGARIDTS